MIYDSIDKVKVLFFSPCGNVRKAAVEIGAAVAERLGVGWEEEDFTPPAGRQFAREYGKGEVVVLATPVYAGRVPNKIMPYIAENIRASGAVGVPVVAYGNRAYDDALSELRLLMHNNGFFIAAGCAVVSEHSFADTLATGRPNAIDLKKLAEFGGRIAEKIQNGGEELDIVPGADPPERYYVPRRLDGQPAKFLKAVPQVDLSRCDHCGICASVCPMGSVDVREPDKINGVCIKCQACIKSCPGGARSILDDDFQSHRRMLMSNFTNVKESELYL